MSSSGIVNVSRDGHLGLLGKVVQEFVLVARLPQQSSALHHEAADAAAAPGASRSPAYNVQEHLGRTPLIAGDRYGIPSKLAAAR